VPCRGFCLAVELLVEGASPLLYSTSSVKKHYSQLVVILVATLGGCESPSTQIVISVGKSEPAPNSQTNVTALDFTHSLPRHTLQEAVADRKAWASYMKSYDAKVCAKINDRWHTLMDGVASQTEREAYSEGKLVLQFDIFWDGHVANVKVPENTFDQENRLGRVIPATCLSAVLDAAPYEKWPEGYRQLVGTDHRSFQFTFSLK